MYKLQYNSEWTGNIFIISYTFIYFSFEKKMKGFKTIQ